MTVKELIDHLQQFEQETEVKFTHVDRTGWYYEIDMCKGDICLDDPENDDVPDEMYDEDDNYIGPQILKFSLFLD